jgi:hypothetical protein
MAVKKENILTFIVLFASCGGLTEGLYKQVNNEKN